jgi:CubicO group peptidase (beta-lactamase class C family)
VSSGSKKRLIALALGIGAAVWWLSRSDEPGEPRNAKVDALFAQWSGQDTPGCTVGVSQDGTVVHEAAYGMASLELGVPLTTESVLPAASISKQFTAMSVLLLEQQQKLSIDDPVRKHIPELHDFGTPLTLRHLLNHTSGLRDAFNLAGWSVPDDPWSDPNAVIVKVLARQRGLNFSPGQRFQYNNGGYNLLAHIVRRVSGQSLREYADGNIFKPLGMTSTHFHDDPGMVVPKRASNYWQDSSGWHVGSETAGVVGNAGLQTTVGDLLRWQRGLEDGRVGDARLVAAMRTPPTLTSGETTVYAFGVNASQYRSVRVIEHGGGDRGISTYLAAYPDQKLVVAVLCNSDAIPSGALTQQIADIYLESALAPASQAQPAGPVAAPVHVPAERLAAKTGWYADPKGGLLRMTVRDEKLTITDIEGDDVPFELTPVDPDRFVLLFGGVPATSVDFSGANAETMSVAPFGGGEPQVFQRVRATPASDAFLKTLTGEYRSDELDVTYQIEMRPGGLVMHRPGRRDMSVDAIDGDTLGGSDAGIVRLLREAVVG